MRSLVLLTLILPIQGFSPAILGVGRFFDSLISSGKINTSPPQTTIAPNQGNDNDMLVAAKFFTESFWNGKRGAGANKLSPSQYNLLLSTQISEFRKKYGRKKRTTRTGKQGPAELLVCKSKNGEEIIGCAGIEISPISISMGIGRRRNMPKTAPSIEAPLMSNLVVGEEYRRKGIAEDLVKAAEELARNEWGYNDCYLYVDKQNIPAFKLYKKLGYKVEWQDDTATILTPDSKGGIVKAPTVILCMRKMLKGEKNIFSSL